MKLRAKIPDPFQFLFDPARYKVAHGGRGSGKSWGFATSLLIRGKMEPLRILCAREIQNSIRESVHKLLSDLIRSMDLTSEYQITDRSIKGANGTEFIFEGLLRNVDKIKSLEGTDICWVEEAHNVSESSWNLLTPTIRKENSEIWVSFNPKYEDDSTYQRFVANPPENAVVRLVNFSDNPYFPQVLRQEMEQDKARDKVLYEHKWLGKAVGIGGKIWGAFKKDLHIKTVPMEEIAKKGNCFMAMDPHSRYYPFIVWMAVLPKNDRGNYPEDFYKHIYAEYPTFEDLGGYYHELRKKLFYNGSLEDIARKIYASDGTEHGIKVLRRFIDSRYAKGAGGWNWSTSTQGIVELFAQEENGGLRLECPFEKQIDIQREVIHKDMLYNKHAPINQWNEPAFSVDPRCKNVIMSLTNHRLEEDPQGEGSKEKESEKYKDASDALRICYAGIFDHKYKPPGEDSTYNWNRKVGGAKSWMG